jgi:iron complex transport system substrate-binding protein
VLRRRFCLLAGAQALLAWLPSLAAGASAPRIACVDWAAAESLAWLGAAPIAVPELATYRRWLPAPALPAGTLNLGARSEPNLELLAAIRPDRIILSGWQSALRTRLARIAPTELAVLFDARRDPYARIRELLLRLGRSIGREALARDRLSASDALLDGLRRTLAGAPHRAAYVAVLDENGTQAFVYGKGSWVDTVMARIGLSNAWTGLTSFYGSSLASIAELADDEEAAIFYLDQGARTRRAEARLRASTLWRGLPAVADGRAVAIPAFYALGGVPSALRCAQALSDAMRALTPQGRP